MRFVLVILLCLGLFKGLWALSFQSSDDEILIPKVKAMKSYIQIWGFVKYHQINLQKDQDFPFFGAIHFLNQKDFISQREFNFLINYHLIKYLDIKALIDYDVFNIIEDHLDCQYLDNNNKQLLGSWLKKFINTKNINNRYVRINSRGEVFFTNEMTYMDSVPGILEFRILSIARLYNAIKYFYSYLPSKHYWDLRLEDFLNRAFEVNSVVQYHLLMLEYASAIKDSNGSIALGLSGSKILENHLGRWAPLVEFFCREDSVFIARCSKKLSRQLGNHLLQPIQSINGVQTNLLLDSLGKYINASNDLIKQRDVPFLIRRGQKNSLIRLKFGDGYETTIKRTQRLKSHLPKDLGKEQIRTGIINDSVLFVNLGSLNNNDRLGVILNQNPKSQILVLDLTQKIKNLPFDFWDYFETEGAIAKTKGLMDVKNPGKQKLIFTEKSSKSGSSTPKFRGMVYILISEFTQNKGETMAMELKSIKRSKFIGRPSAGAEGEISKITLAGGFFTSFTSTSTHWLKDGYGYTGIVPEILLPMLHLDDKMKVLKHYFNPEESQKEDTAESSSKK